MRFGPTQIVQRAIALIAAALVSTLALAAPQVQFFNPQGQAKEVRQATARFSEPVVAFGDPRLADPFDVRCDGDPERSKGRGRWADTRNWIYDFEADLPAGLRCRFALKADFKSSNGQPIEGAKEFSFTTGGPAVRTSLPHEGDEQIDDEQIFILAMDAPVDTASLSGAWCEAAGVNERIPVKAVSDKETREILEANKSRAYNLFTLYLKNRREIPLARFKIEDKRWKDLPIVGVRCAQRLPAGADVALVVGPQVKTKSGIERGTPQRLAFKVREAFTVKLTCERMNKDAACLPVTSINVAFTAPVPRDTAQKIRLKAKDGKSYEPTLDKDVNTVSGVEFKPPFPEKTSFVLELPRDFRDDAGREPENKASFPLATATDEFPPLAKFPSRFGILELNADPLLPVSVRNVEAKLGARQVDVGAIPARSARIDDETAILKRYRSFMKREYEASARKARNDEVREGEVQAIAPNEKATAFEVPHALGDKAIEVIGIPMKKPGFYIVELASPRLGRALHGEEKPYYVSTSVLVTNLGVHLKHGREGSLVWVTSLDKGKPVPNAAVTVRDCTGKVYFEGRTDANGIALAGDKLPTGDTVPHCGDYERVLIAFARVGGDLAFTYSNWNEGIQPWNFRLHAERRARGSVDVHTVFDRMLFRAGETVSMKHIARVPVGAGFRLPQPDEAPTDLQIEHLGSGQKYKLATSFDAKGIAESTWTIPQEAKLGTYEVSWPGKRGIVSRESFRVEAFRVPLMRAVLNPPKAPAIRPKELKLDTVVTYLSGGPAANAPVKMRYRVERRTIEFADYSDFRFGGQPIREGVQKGEIEDLWDTYDPDEGNAEASADNAAPTTVRSLTLDAAGTAKLPIDKLPPIDRPASLLVELEYSDPNGEILATSTRVPLHPAGVYVGIKPESWAANRRNGVSAQLVVLDTAGKPLANRAASIDVYERRTYSNRRRLVGGFYAYDTTTEVRRAGSACSGTTDARGILFCTIKPKTSGELILAARAKDDGGREALSTTSVWVQGDEEWWFEPSNNDRIDLIAEKRYYEPGETAKLQVRMPFRQATVLVTVEREGVLWQKVVELDGKSPTIEVPVLGNYGPNVYVSALALRGRVEPEVPGPYAWLKRWIYKIGYWLGLVDEVPVERDTRPTALVDLAKPAYKLGMTEIKVGRRDYTLDVKVTPERDVLKVRDTARVAVQVSDADGKPPVDGEIALAAVDEGLLELMNNTSWDVLEALLDERPIEVMTATAQGMVIGKRHFGRKAAPPGGGGGRAGARELFDTLLLWKGRVPLDAQGRASMAIPLNDALTSFRIVAVATAGASKFGHGGTTVRTTQDLMLFSGLPPVVREQDEYNAMFTVRNATQQPLATKFSWVVRDKPADDKSATTLANGESAVSLAPNEAKIVSVPMKTPIGVERLYWQVIAAGGSGQDRLRAEQKVVEVDPVRVYQATLARLDKPLEFPVERPAEAVPGRGGIHVDVMGTLGSELTGVREYFAKYPYTCLEQRVSKAIGLNDDKQWDALSSSVSSYLDRDGLARYFPIDTLQGSDALTAYLVQIAHDGGREWPDAALERMLSGLEAFVTGKITRYGALPAADLTIRKLAAIEALSRHGKARSNMLDSITIDPALWPTSALIDWIGILKRINNLPQRETRLNEAFGLLRARMNFQGTAMTFSTERNDALWWLMASGDVNANRALIAVLGEADWREDVGRLVRGTLSRQKRGRWNTTVANAWGTVAMARFSDAFEKTPASGSATITLGGKQLPLKVTAERQSEDLAWPSGREALTIAHSGSGAPWAVVQSRAALPLKAPVFTGYSVKRTVTPVEQKERGAWSRGDVYRVTLDVDAQSDMTWVVVDDPIPAGALILGSGLGRDAASLTQGEKQAGWASPAFVERTQEAYRAYYAFVPKGRFKLEYTVRLNNPGRFDLPATRVEALYAPEMFAELPNQGVAVKP